jgi:hypothetical protein
MVAFQHHPPSLQTPLDLLPRSDLLVDYPRRSRPSDCGHTLATCRGTSADEPMHAATLAARFPQGKTQTTASTYQAQAQGLVSCDSRLEPTAALRIRAPHSMLSTTLHSEDKPLSHVLHPALEETWLLCGQEALHRTTLDQDQDSLPSHAGCRSSFCLCVGPLHRTVFQAQPPLHRFRLRLGHASSRQLLHRMHHKQSRRRGRHTKKPLQLASKDSPGEKPWSPPNAQSSGRSKTTMAASIPFSFPTCSTPRMHPFDCCRPNTGRSKPTTISRNERGHGVEH